MAIDSQHLPEDPKVLQKMVLDLIAQLDRESAERHKIEAMLRELLDARRNRKSEQLSADQLALFAAAWEARQAAEASKPVEDSNDSDNDTKPNAGPAGPKKNNGGRQPLAKHLKRERIVHDLTDSEKHCETCAQDLRPIGEESSERYEYIPAHDGGRGCMQEIRLQLHGEDGHQAAATDREKHRWSECSGAGDCGQDSRSPALTPAREDL
jgi:Transposase C of IS166 homeodomain